MDPNNKVTTHIPNSHCMVIITANTTDVLAIIRNSNGTDGSVKETFTKSCHKSTIIHLKKKSQVMKLNIIEAE